MGGTYNTDENYKKPIKLSWKTPEGVKLDGFKV
jgi:hypothetical protein